LAHQAPGITGDYDAMPNVGGSAEAILATLDELLA
jgi:hypothetical protein